MARSGVTKATVQRARQALIARGEHPSIDAVRIELGNTGSKTTIHRYLKELDVKQPSEPLAPAGLNEQLARLVEHLATQLHEQAQVRIREAETMFTEQREHLQAQLQLAQQALAQAHRQQQIQASALEAESEKLAATLSTLQAEQLRSASLNQSLGELQVRLADKDEQIRSLEDYRVASGEQRELERLRHEGQVHQLRVELRQAQQGMTLKQEEMTRLHRDNERLLGESRQVAAEHKLLNEQLEQRDAQIQGLRSILAQAQGASDEMRRQLDRQAQRLERERELCGEQALQLLDLQRALASRDAASAACQAHAAEAGQGG